MAFDRLLAVDLAEHDVERTDVRRHVGELVAPGHHVERSEMRETRRADLAAVGLVGAIGHEIDAELALGRLDGGVGLAGRHLVALGVKLEVMDQGFHRALHLTAAWRRDLAVVDAYWAGHGAQRYDALLHDAGALVHLLDAHEVAREAVAGLADRDVEVHALVDVVGLRLAQVPRDARGADHRAREPPVECLLRVNDADVDHALTEDAVVVQQLLDVLDEGVELLDPAFHGIEHAVWQILMHAAGSEVVGMHARTAHALIVFHQQFALLEAPQWRRQRAHVHGERRDIQEMVEDARDLREQHTDVLTALGRGDAKKLFYGKSEGVLLVHRRDVVEPVEIWDRLQIGFVLDQLLGAAMQQPDMRIAALDDLAVHLDDQAQHAVGRRMLRPEIHCQRFDLDVGHDANSLPSRRPSRHLAVPGARLPTGSGSRNGGIP